MTASKSCAEGEANQPIISREFSTEIYKILPPASMHISLSNNLQQQHQNQQQHQQQLQVVEEETITTDCNLHCFRLKTYRSPTFCAVCRRFMWGLRNQGVVCTTCDLNCHRKCSQSADFIRPCSAAAAVTPAGQRYPTPSRDNISVVSMESAPLVSAREEQEGIMANTTNIDINNDDTKSAYKSSPVPLPITPISLKSRRSPSVSTVQKHHPITTTLSRYATHSILHAIDERQRQRRSSCMPTVSANRSLSGSGAAIVGRSLTVRSIRSSSPSPSAAFKTILRASAAKASDIRGSPPLNVFTTLPKNFTRFVMKVGPLAEFQEKVEGIFLWRNPTETLLAMAVYITLCLNPLSLLLCPHALVLFIIWRNYYHHHTKPSGRMRSTQQPQQQYPRRKTVNPLLLRPDQISYSKNMQFIQNTMGMYSDAYEQYRINSERIDWSDDKTIASIVRIWLLSALAIIFGHPYIPWRLVLIAVGLAVFTANTGAGLAVRSHLTSVHWSEMLNRCRAPVDRLWKAWRIKSASQLLAQQHKLQNYADNEQLQYHSDELDNLLVVECFENQRYWAGMGWIPHMLSSERPPWSDGKGTRSMRPKEEYQEPGELINSGMAFESNLTADCVPVESQSLPAGVEWHWHPESIWAVDTEWAKGLSATSDSLLIDRDGWLYSDHKWQFQKKTSKRCLTRQRRWIRVAQGCPAASAG